MPTTHDIEMTLDLDKSGASNVAQAAVIRQGDTASTRLIITIEDGGEAADLTGLSARIEATKPDGNPYQQACAIEGNVCTVTLDGQASAFPGRTLVCYVALYQGTTFRGSTQDFPIQVLRAYDSDGGTSTPYSDALDGTLAEYQERLEAMATATAASAEATSGATSATGAATDAAQAATDAAEEAGDATNAANAAANTANAAATSANSAANAASEAADEALAAADEARGAVSPDMRLYLAYDDVGGTEYISLMDVEED